MKTSGLDAATVSLHEELFETQMSLQSRLLDYIEQANAFAVLDDAWSEFNLYENVPLDPDDPEPALHFFPWALFYWRRDVSAQALETADDPMLITDADSDGDDENLFEGIESMDTDEIARFLSDALEAGNDQDVDEGLDGDLDDEFEGENLDEHDEDESLIGLPPIAVMFMDRVDHADDADATLADVNLSVKDRQFIEAAAQAPYSFYKVLEVGPGAFVTVEDLIVPGQVRVYAEALVDMMAPDDVIYGQIVTSGDAHLLCSVAPMVLPSLVLDALSQASARIGEMSVEIGEDARHETEFEMRSLYQSLIEQLEALDDEASAADGQNGNER